jgi:hypothetical protein
MLVAPLARVQSLSLLASALAGVLLGSGHFGGAAAALLLASFLRSKRKRTVSGDAADRYAELFAFSGLALYFRAHLLLFTLTLAALLGSLMVSYGSAKAEARHVPVPAGAMRRPTRVACLTAGALLTSVVAHLGSELGAPPWAGDVPVALAVIVLAVGANVSAVLRLRIVAMASVPRTPSRDARPLAAPAATASAGQKAA